MSGDGPEAGHILVLTGSISPCGLAGQYLAPGLQLMLLVGGKSLSFITSLTLALLLMLQTAALCIMILSLPSVVIVIFMKL